jgi:hypothetical protein
MGAAFGTIHQVHTADSFATMALQKLDAFLETAGRDERYVFESHPLQSTVRVLLQLDTAAFIDRLVDSWKFPKLALAALTTKSGRMGLFNGVDVADNSVRSDI